MVFPAMGGDVSAELFLSRFVECPACWAMARQQLEQIRVLCRAASTPTQAKALCRCAQNGRRPGPAVAVEWVDGLTSQGLELDELIWCLPLRRLSLPARLSALMTGQLPSGRAPTLRSVARVELPARFDARVQASARLARCLGSSSWVALADQLARTSHLKVSELAELADLAGPQTRLSLGELLVTARLLA